MKRSYPFAILLGIVPLGVLTLSSLLNVTSMLKSASGSQPDEVNTAAPQLDDAKTRLAETEEQVKGAQPILMALSEGVVRPYDAVDPVPDQNATASFSDLVTPWKAFKASRDLVSRFVASATPLVDPTALSDEAIEEERRKLLELKGQMDGENALQVRGIDGLRTAVNKQISETDSLLSDRKRALKNDSVLAAAKKAFGDGQYDASIKKLDDEWEGPFSAQAASLMQSAKFRSKAESLMPRVVATLRTQPNTLWTVLIQEIDRFINVDFPKAPTEADELRHERFTSVLTKLQAKLAIHDHFQRPPGGNLQLWLQDAQAILERFPDGESKRLMAEGVRTWLKTAVVEKVADAVDFQMAVTYDGALAEGVFELFNAGKHYKWWESRKVKENDPNNFTSLPVQKLAVLPRDPPTVMCVATYTQQRTTLLGRIESKQQWEQFLQSCQEQQRQLDEYDKKKGEKVQVSFDKEVQFARQVIENWDRIALLISP
jgi:hypothetical protein